MVDILYFDEGIPEGSDMVDVVDEGVLEGSDVPGTHLNGIKQTFIKGIF